MVVRYYRRPQRVHSGLTNRTRPSYPGVMFNDLDVSSTSSPIAAEYRVIQRDAVKASLREPPEVEVVVEVPRGSFLKRGSTGQIDFISPLPCPFNYGSVLSHIGQEGDLLDA